MFVDAVRRYADHLPPDSSGWLAGLLDRFVGRTLALMHEQPAHEWTIDGSAGALGCRARPCTNACPADRVPRCSIWPSGACRPRRACCFETRATIAAIALDVGYDSEAAFTRAFKRLVGKPPATWRRERDAAVA
jgi:AraC-like DNA-binding protein